MAKYLIKDAVAKYIVKQVSFINGALAQPGETVDYDLPEGTTVSSNLELVAEDTDEKPKLEPATEDTDEKQKRKSAKGEPT